VSAGAASTEVDRAVAVGVEAMGAANVTSAADGTVAIGWRAGYSITSGAANTVIGYQALDSATTNGHNTCIGYQAGKGASNANYTYNVLIGKNAGTKSSGDGGDSIYNVGVGNDVLTGLNGGDRNNCIGRAAGDSITTGARNQLIGVGTDISVVNGHHQ
jgi:hypothetical protein